MKNKIISMTSVNQAMRARDVAVANNIPVSIVRLNSEQSKKGCAYGLVTDGVFLETLLLLLKRKGIPYSGVY